MELAAELTLGEEARDVTALVEEHQRMVYQIAYSLLRNHHDAEDAAQEAFLRVWRAGSRLARVADTKAWVARIAWNVASDRLRRNRPSAAPLDPEELAATVRDQHRAGRSGEEIAAGREIERLLEALIASLPRKLRQPLLLSTVEELSAEEIGQVMGLKPAAVRARLFQARQLLRQKLDSLLGKKP